MHVAPSKIQYPLLSFHFIALYMLSNSQKEIIMEMKCDHNHALGNSAGQVITCKAALAWGPKQPLIIQEIQVDPPQTMEVRIKIIHTTLCHTDIISLSMPDDRMYPKIFGHEGAGIIESVGEGVTDLKPGDHVILLYMGECGDCEFCKSNKTNLCKDYRVGPFNFVMKDGKTRFSVDGKPVYHFMNTSTFSEYTVVHYANVVKIDTSLPLSIACLLGCGVSTGIGAAWNTANVEAGSTIAIFGLGTVGLANSILRVNFKGIRAAWNTANVEAGSTIAVFGFGTVGLAVAEGARSRKAQRIIGIDTNPNKFSIAKAFGVTEFLNPRDHEKPVHEIVRLITNGGADYSFECVGNTEVVNEAFLSTHEGWGTTIMLGYDGLFKPLVLNTVDLVLGRKILAPIFGGFKGKSQIPSLVKKCIDKEVNVEGFITHQMPFSDINSSFDLMSQGNCLRCLLHF